MAASTSSKFLLLKLLFAWNKQVTLVKQTEDGAKNVG